MPESVSTPQESAAPAGRGRQTRRAAIWVAVLSLAVAGLFLLRAFDPKEATFYPKCMLHQWTGLHCPGCGATRALGALSRGLWWDAIRNNPLLMLGGPVILLLIWIQRRRERGGSLASPRLAWGLFVLLVVYTIARNVPSPQRSWLAPPPVESKPRDFSTTRDG